MSSPITIHCWDLPYISCKLCKKSSFGMVFKSLATFHWMLGILSNLFPFKTSLSRGNRKKSEVLRSGEYCGCSIYTAPFLPGTVWKYWLCGGEYCHEKKKKPLNLVERTRVVPCIIVSWNGSKFQCTLLYSSSLSQVRNSLWKCLDYQKWRKTYRHVSFILVRENCKILHNAYSF